MAPAPLHESNAQRRYAEDFACHIVDIITFSFSRRVGAAVDLIENLHITDNISASLLYCSIQSRRDARLLFQLVVSRWLTLDEATFRNFSPVLYARECRGANNQPAIN